MKNITIHITTVVLACLFTCPLFADDKAILEAVHTHLKDYPPTSTLEATVEVEEGVVSISGVAESLPVKTLAVKTASKVQGVRAIINRLVVKEVRREDDVIQSDLDQLFALNYPDAKRSISAHVNDGVVTLKGTVSTLPLRQLSEVMAASAKGVRDVVNLLHIKPLTPANDDEIAQHIALALKGDPWIEDELVKITVNEGVVSLNGAVDSFSEKSRLESAVSLYGVKEIDTENLQVSPELRPRMQRPHEPLFATDEELQSALKMALMKDPRVLSDNVEVSVVDRDVTLTGAVWSVGAKAAAEADARNVPGVELVFSFLDIDAGTEMTEEALETAIAAVLDGDALMAGASIDPKVKSQTVELHGAVVSPFQRRRAMHIAANALSVERVVSKLRVDWDMPEAYSDKTGN